MDAEPTKGANSTALKGHGTDSAGGLQLGSVWDEWPIETFIRVVFSSKKRKAEE